MSDQGMSPLESNAIKWLAGLLLGGANISMGDWYVELARVAAKANIDNTVALMMVDAVLNKWAVTGVVGALLAWRGLRAWIASHS